MEGNFLEKSNVYSFGVLMLEIISGKKNSCIYHPERPINLAGYVSILHTFHIYLICFALVDTIMLGFYMFKLN
jgi:hypothetical protein